ncbi:MAG: ABC transporter substrate-binding protein [Roseibium sp.]|uniref:ABC transporter substrate-binding protein n=1 Tax=Roseibium sp. TaxID=1936156 RepID=UPI00262254CA|nr:ABC transporter substrate-binding protein [Roseibium sp.]MCV0424727.1 ABC transporter substrate-binding protein [Roseibium sp.]
MRLNALLSIAVLLHLISGAPTSADDRTSISLGAGTAVRDLLDEMPEPVALFGLSESSLALVAGKESEKANRLFLTSGATSPKLTSEVPIHLFLACFGDNVQAATAAEYAFGTLSARSVSVLYDDGHTYTNLLQGYFSEAFGNLGGEIASLVPFQGPENFAEAIGKVKDADVLFLAAETPQGALGMVTELRANGFSQPIIGGDGYDGENVWQQNPDISDVYYTTHAYFGPSVKTGPAAVFSKQYAEAYQGQRPNGFAGLGYDAVGLLASAIERAGSTDPDAVLLALSNTKSYAGVTGTISYLNGDHVPVKTVTLMKITSGEPVFVEKIFPETVPKP